MFFCSRVKLKDIDSDNVILHQIRSVLSRCYTCSIMLAMLMGAAMVTDLQNPLEMQVFGID